MKRKIPEWMEPVLQQLKRFQYPLLIFLVGIGLMLLPAGQEKGDEKAETAEPMVLTDTLEQRLETALRQVEGAGEVRVILTLKTGAVSCYQENVEQHGGEDGETRTETVILSNNGSEQPVLVKTVYPTYLGAVVICQGADRASVKLDILRAVSSLTGLSSEHITVIKMKCD